MLITFIRHAEIQSSDIGHYIGHTDSPLSTKGSHDAAVFATYFTKYNQNNRFDAIYCSDLSRCQQTLAPFLNELKVKTKPSITTALREKSWGKHEGKSFEDICHMENTEYKNFEQWLNVLDGESVESFIQRIKNFKQMLSNKKYKNTLIMTHSGVIRTFIYLMSDLSFEKSFSISIPYASFVILNLEEVD